MTQYFTFVNETKQEYLKPDTSSSEAVARVTDPVGTGILAYLLIDGPQDGTRFTELVNPHAPEIEAEMSEFIADEREQNRNEGRTSVYRNDDGSWNRARIAEVIAAGHHVSDDNEYAGRWAGDEIRLVGDYADNDLYANAREDWVYEYNGEEFTTTETGEAPVVPESIDDPTIVHSTENRDVRPGDLCAVRHPDTGDRIYAEFRRVAESDWTDITRGVEREFRAFAGNDWVEEHADTSRIRPNMLVAADEAGNTSVYKGDQATAVIESSTGPTETRNDNMETQDSSLDEFLPE